MSYFSGAAYPASAHRIVLDDTFRDLLASALIARHRTQLYRQPELMLMRSTGTPTNGPGLRPTRCWHTSAHC